MEKGDCGSPYLLIEVVEALRFGDPEIRSKDFS
jgi:hypothetical protein